MSGPGRESKGRWRLPEFSKMTRTELIAWAKHARAHPSEFPEEGFDEDDVSGGIEAMSEAEKTIEELRDQVRELQSRVTTLEGLTESATQNLVNLVNSMGEHLRGELDAQTFRARLRDINNWLEQR